MPKIKVFSFNILSTFLFIFWAAPLYADKCSVKGVVCNLVENDCNYSIFLHPPKVQQNKIRLIFHHKKDLLNFLDELTSSFDLSTNEERFLFVSDLLDPEEEYLTLEEAFMAKLYSFDLNDDEVEGLLKIYLNF